MDSKEATGTFKQTSEYQKNYGVLLGACRAGGTTVLYDRVFEHDRDIAPYDFVRKGTVEYIFPAQDVSLVEDTSGVTDPSPGYELRAQNKKFHFDESLVKGRILIEYEDANNRPILKVTDVLGNSELPERVQETIDRFF
jgi:hypothetical protein